MDMRNNERRNVWTRASNFQPVRDVFASAWGGGWMGWEFSVLLVGGGGLTDPISPPGSRKIRVVLTANFAENIAPNLANFHENCGNSRIFSAKFHSWCSVFRWLVEESSSCSFVEKASIFLLRYFSTIKKLIASELRKSESSDKFNSYIKWRKWSVSRLFETLQLFMTSLPKDRKHQVKIAGQ